jgi:hypothetical protein
MGYSPVQTVGYQNGYYPYYAPPYQGPMAGYNYAPQAMGYGYAPPPSAVPGYWYGR